MQMNEMIFEVIDPTAMRLIMELRLTDAIEFAKALQISQDEFKALIAATWDSGSQPPGFTLKARGTSG